VTWTLTQSGLVLGGSMTLAGGQTSGGTINNTVGTVAQNSYPTNVDLTSGAFTVGGFSGVWTIRFVGTTDSTGTTMTGALTTIGTTQGNFPKTATFRR
jgi:hypothetical protein